MRKVRGNAQIPSRQTKGSAGYDLYACCEADMEICSGERVLVPTGIAAEIPEGYAGMIFCRSSLGCKYGVGLPNGVGVIDSDYRGEIHVGLYNFSAETFSVKNGDRIAQLIFMPVLIPEIEVSEELSHTERGVKGFGSTGK